MVMRGQQTCSSGLGVAYACVGRRRRRWLSGGTFCPPPATWPVPTRCASGLPLTAPTHCGTRLQAGQCTPCIPATATSTACRLSVRVLVVSDPFGFREL